MIHKLKSKYKENLKDKNFIDIINGSLMTFSAKIATVIFGFISNLIISKYYGSEVLGTLSVLFSIMSIASIFSLLGMNVSILRFLPPLLKKKEYYSAFIVIKRTIILVVVFAFVSSFIIYIFSNFIAGTVFNKSYLTSLIMLISIFIFFQGLGTISASIIRALQNIKLFVILQFLPSFLNLVILMIITYIVHYKYTPLYTQLFSQLTVTLISLIFLYKIIKKYKLEIKVFDKLLSYKNILIISAPMFLTSIMQMVVLQTDVLMLGSLDTLINVGIYSVVVKFALLSSFVIGSINTIIAPKFSELYYNNEINELRRIARKSTKLIFYLTLPLSLILIFFGEQLLLIFGNEFRSGYYALIMLTVGQLVNIMAGSVGYLLNMTGRQNTLNKIVLFSALINIGLNAFLIPIYGINGAAFASMISAIIWNILASYNVKKHIGVYIGYIPIFHKEEK